jgi:tRNA U34 5-carboxymethylaminomethyl modifying GTPase MnmE/TrmE
MLPVRQFHGRDVAELRRWASLRLSSDPRRFRAPAAEAGSTRRAFIAGRLDITEVEGLADLIQAETEAQRRQALRQASGAQRRVFEAWRGRLITARAMVEAELDFADEDDVPDHVSARAWEDVRGIATEIARHLDDGRRGERLRDGAEVVVTGPVNAGKSSLINALAQRDVAIVSDEPGTTRDDRGPAGREGYPFTIVDTAGSATPKARSSARASGGGGHGRGRPGPGTCRRRRRRRFRSVGDCGWGRRST